MELNESLKCNACITELLNDYILDYNTFSNTLSLSKEWKTLLGYEDAEIANSFEGLFKTLDKADHISFKNTFDNFINSSESSRSFEYKFTCKNGSPKWLALKIKKVNWAQAGVNKRVLLFYTDISPYKSLIRNLDIEFENKKTLIDSSPDLLFSINKHFKLTTANKASLDLFQTRAITPPLKIGDNVLEGITHPLEQKSWWKKQSQRAFKGENFLVETNFIDPATNIKIWTETQFTPIYDGDKINSIAIFSRDISTRKEIEVQFQAKKEKLELLVQGFSDWVWETDANGVYVYCSDKIISVLGYTKSEIIGKTPYDFMPEDEREKIKIQFKTIVENKAPIKDLENWNLHKYGHRVCLLTNGYPLFDEAGNLRGYFGVDKDITEKKKKDEQLLILEAVLDNAKIGIMITEAEPKELSDQRILYINDEICTLTGYSKDELIGKNPRILQGAETNEITKKIMADSLKKWEPVQVDILNYKKNGAQFWNNISITPVATKKDSYTHFISIQKDVSKEKAAAALKVTTLEKLLKSELRFHTMFKNHSAKMLLIEPHTGNIVEANDAAMAYYGYTYAQFSQLNMRDLNKFSVTKIKALAKKYSKKMPEIIHETHTLASGEKRVLEIRSSVIEENGRPLIFSILVDVTDKINAEKQLQLEKDKLEAIIKALPDTIVQLDKDNRYVYVHASDERNLLLKEDEYNGKHISEVLPPAIVAQLEEKITEAHQTNNLVKRLFSMNFSNQGTKYFESRLINTLDGGILDIVRDISGQKEAEEALERSNERFKYASNATSDGIWDWDIKNNKVYWSDVYKSIFEYESENNLGDFKSWNSKIHEADIKDVTESLEKALNSQELKWSKEYRFIKGNGNYATVSDNGYIIRDENGVAIRIVGAMRDITLAKQTEQLIVDNLKIIETVQKVANIGYFITNIKEGTWTRSQIYDEIFGIDEHFPRTVENFRTLIVKEYLEEQDEIYNKAIENKRDFVTTYQIIRHNDKKIRWIKAYGKIIYDNNEQPYQVIGATQDITENENLQQDRERILESIKDNFYVLDNDLNIQFCNKPMLDFLETELGLTELNGKYVYDLFPFLLDNDFSKALKESIDTKSPVHIDIYVAVLDNWFEQHFYPFDGGCTIIFKSINQRKQAEKKLLTLNHELIEKTEELKDSNIELERFAYVASHDLQEPLRMVSNFLQLFKERYNDVVDETGKKYIHFAVDGADRMKGLIKDLLLFSRSGTSSIKTEEVDMSEIVKDILLLHADEFAKEGNQITIDSLPVIMADNSSMMQVMQNLIGNAVKYRNPEQMIIHVGVEASKKEWLFSVKDNGIGIDQQYADKIFVIFQRLHNKKEYSGNGIGLSITKKIIDRYKGKIWVESTPGEGSTFKFTIPKK